MAMTKHVNTVTMMSLGSVIQAYADNGWPKTEHRRADRNPLPNTSVASWELQVWEPSDQIWNQLATDDVAWHIGQVELGEKSGKYHLHVFLHYPTKRKMPYKKYPGCRLAPVGFPYKYMTYCTKERTRVAGPWVFPNKEAVTCQGERSDLANMADLILEGGTSLAEAAKSNPSTFARMGRGLRDLAATTIDHRTAAPQVHRVCSRREAGELLEQHGLTKVAAYWKPARRGWPGYEARFHKWVIISLDSLKAAEQDEIEDSHPYSVQVGQQDVPFVAEHIIYVQTAPESHLEKMFS